MELNQSGETRIHQILVKLLDGTHRFLNFTSPIITIETLKHKIETLTSTPAHHHLLLLLNHRALPESDHQTLNISPSGSFPAVVELSARLRGGKGGFGSLLRGSATKAGQKKTNNFDACRDMNGRRIRHVNAEKKIEEWKAGAEERRLEKAAEDYLKKKAKEAAKKGSGKGAEVDKYVQKYNADSKKCREELERSVRESMKRKVGSSSANGSELKKLKIWYGKRKMGISDSEDDSEEEDEEEENNKSAVLNSGDHSDSSEGAKGSSDSVKEACHVASSSGSGVSETASDEEKAAVEEIPEADESRAVHEEAACVAEPQLGVSDEHKMESSIVETGAVEEEKEPSSEPKHAIAVEKVIEASVLSNVDKAAPGASDSNGAVADAEPMDLEKPLNFDEINSAADLEVLGMDRLKSELQTRGLKCGGTLQERSARLFLLKTTPIEKLPKKYLAKK